MAKNTPAAAQEINETPVPVNVEQFNAPAVAKNAEAGMLIGSSQDIFKSNLMAMWTSIDPDKKALILRASGDADFSLIGFFDKNPAGVLDIVDVLIHNVQLADDEPDENGEQVYSTQARTVLIAKDGTTYSAVSQGVLGSLQRIIALYGPPTWPAGLKLTARRVKTRKFQTIQLLVQE